MTEPSLLRDLARTVDSYGFEILFWPHCLLVASWFPHLKNRFLLSYWVGFLAAAGGGVVTSILMQNPAYPVALFSLNSIGIIWTVSWWLVNYFPYHVVSRTIRLFPVRVCFKACLNTLRAGLIAQRVQVATTLYPGVIAAPLVLGTIAGCAGKFCIDILTGSSGDLQGPSELAVPGFAARSAFAGALLYYLLVNVNKVFAPEEGKALVILLYVVHGLLSDFTGQALDFTWPFAKAFHGVTNIPMPEHPAHLQTKPKPASSTESKKKQ